jgi:hypothetical protein
VVVAVVKLVAFGSPPELLTQKDIPDRVKGERTPQRGTVEMRDIPRSRECPHVGYDLDLMPLQHVKEGFE